MIRRRDVAVIRPAVNSRSSIYGPQEAEPMSSSRGPELLEHSRVAGEGENLTHEPIFDAEEVDAK